MQTAQPNPGSLKTRHLLEESTGRRGLGNLGSGYQWLIPQNDPRGTSLLQTLVLVFGCLCSRLKVRTLSGPGLSRPVAGGGWTPCLPFSPDHVQSEAGRFGWKQRERSLRWPVRPAALRIQEPLASFFPASNRGARERSPGKHCRAVGGREWDPSYLHEPPGTRVLPHVASCWLPSTKGQGQCAGCRATSSRTLSSQHAQPSGVFDLLRSSQGLSPSPVSNQATEPLPLADAINRGWPAARSKWKGFGFREEIEKGTLSQVELNF